MSGEPTLEKGVSSEWVVYLQEMLRESGYWQGDTNGDFDDDLEQAVQAAQDNLNLTRTGVVDDETWSALEQLAPSVQQPAQSNGSADTGQSSTQQDQDNQQSTTSAAETTNTTDYPTLQKGISSEWVTYLQQVLEALGYWTGAVDGSFGDELEQVVQTLQAGNSLAQTGIVDGQTWDLLANLQNTGAQQTTASIPVDPGLAVKAGGHQYVIFTDEVREGGSVSWKARNPGNIRNGDAYGAYPGKHVDAGSSGHFAVFPDEATGFAAIKSVLHGYGHVTVATAMGRYAPAGDGANDPGAYARQVATQMGVPVTTFVDQLTDDQLTVFATAIRRVEGWVVGHTFTLTDPSLPDAVKHAITGQ